MTFRDSVAIVGVGSTGYLRQQDSVQAVLAARAVRSALDDAGLGLEDVDGVVTEGAVMPRHLSADLLAATCGVRPRWMVQWLVAAAGLVAAPRLAAQAIRAGEADVVVVVHSMGRSASEPVDPYSYHAEDPVKAIYEMPMGWYGQAVYFAAMARRYEHERGSMAHGLEAIALQSRRHAELTPGSQRTTPLDAAGYQADRMIASPLRAADCSLISEGATAYVMTSAERARDLKQPVVLVSGVGVSEAEGVQSTWFTQRSNLASTGAAASSDQAFGQAGISSSDVDVVALYDCFTITVLLQLEEMGFCPPGSAADAAAAGEFGLGGRLPVNTHGGLLAHGFCLGIGHVAEAVRQLRGQAGDAQVPGAEVAAVAGLGAPYHSTLVLRGA